MNILEKIIHTKKSGQILVEAMVALGMVVVGFIGLLSLLSNSIGVNRVVSDQYIASYLASEGIEVVKNIIDNNYADDLAFNSGLSSCESAAGCSLSYDSSSLIAGSCNVKFDKNEHIYNCKKGESTPFTRNIKISEAGNKLTVHSIVTWKTRGGVLEKVDVEDIFYNWR